MDDNQLLRLAIKGASFSKLTENTVVKFLACFILLLCLPLILIQWVFIWHLTERIDEYIKFEDAMDAVLLTTVR